MTIILKSNLPSSPRYHDSVFMVRRLFLLPPIAPLEVEVAITNRKNGNNAVKIFHPATPSCSLQPSPPSRLQSLPLKSGGQTCVWCHSTTGCRRCRPASRAFHSSVSPPSTCPTYFFNNIFQLPINNNETCSLEMRVGIEGGGESRPRFKTCGSRSTVAKKYSCHCMLAQYLCRREMVTLWVPQNKQERMSLFR